MNNYILTGIVIGVIATAAIVCIFSIIRDYCKEQEENRRHEIDMLIRAIDKLEIKTIELEHEVNSLKEKDHEWIQ